MIKIMKLNIQDSTDKNNQILMKLFFQFLKNLKMITLLINNMMKIKIQMMILKMKIMDRIKKNNKMKVKKLKSNYLKKRKN